MSSAGRQPFGAARQLSFSEHTAGLANPSPGLLLGADLCATSGSIRARLAGSLSAQLIRGLRGPVLLV